MKSDNDVDGAAGSRRDEPQAAFSDVTWNDHRGEEMTVLPKLHDPVLISAFTTREKAGAAGSAALAYLLGEWNARPLAEIESDDLYDYTRVRPQVRREGEKTVIDWPTTQAFLATPPGSDRSFVLVLGIEPHRGWKTFVERLTDFARSLGVKTVVSLRAVPAAATHRTPVTVQALLSDDALEDRFGLPGGTAAEGPVDIGLLLSLKLQSQGCETVDVYAMEPYYVPAMPQAATSLALVEAVDRAFGLTTDKSTLQQAVAMETRALEAAVEQSQELQAVVRRLQEAMAPRGLLTAPEESWREQPPLDDGTPLDAGQLISDVEALLGLSDGSNDGLQELAE